MGRHARDLSGSVFGRLTVVCLVESRNKDRNGVSLCRCSCGTEKHIRNQNLLSGQTKSCGCLVSELSSARCKTAPPRLKHGMRRTTTYTCWQGMISRCYNPKDYNYPRYGGRGIVVCTRWSDPERGMENFVKDMGHRPSPAHSIDRIDGAKGYEPGNCRWATRSQQNQNVGLKKSNVSGYKGVVAFRGKWKSEIRNDGDRFHLGVFVSKEEAALAYNIASERLQGVYGVRNPLPNMDRKTTKRVHRIVMSVLDKPMNEGGQLTWSTSGIKSRMISRLNHPTGSRDHLKSLRVKTT